MQDSVRQKKDALGYGACRNKISRSCLRKLPTKEQDPYLHAALAAKTKYCRIVWRMENGIRREGRNGVTYGVFGRQIRFDLSKGFPLLTTKKLHTKSIFGEMLWFISGETNIKPLQDQGITIWNEWADKNGELGPIYGKQWRSWIDY